MSAAAAEIAPGLDALIMEAEGIERVQSEQADKARPDYQSAEDIAKECRERAAWLVGGFQAIACQLKPEAALAVMDDACLEQGVDRVSAVLMKYPGAEPPEWVKRVLKYREEFQAGVWFAGVCYGIHKLDQQLAEEAAEKEADNGDQS